jgi:hypothetical protein
MFSAPCYYWRAKLRKRGELQSVHLKSGLGRAKLELNTAKIVSLFFGQMFNKVTKKVIVKKNE